MFTLKIGKDSYGVRFQYRPVYLQYEIREPPHFVEMTSEHRVEPDTTRTVCQILKLNDKDRTSELICEGSATCTLADAGKFRKSEGRQRSLKKAVDEFAYNWSKPRAVRTLVWEAYFANHKDLRPKKSPFGSACELCPVAPVDNR